MSTFTAYTLDIAAAASKPVLESVKEAFGLLPNLQTNMAESPELLAGYSTHWNLFSKTSLSVAEQQVVYLTAIFENYGMPGHTKLAAMQKVDDAVVQAISAGRPIADAKLEVLQVFTTIVLRERGFASDAAIDAFLNAGMHGATCSKFIPDVGAKLLSTYTNHIVQPSSTHSWRSGPSRASSPACRNLTSAVKLPGSTGTATISSAEQCR